MQTDRPLRDIFPNDDALARFETLWRQITTHRGLNGGARITDTLVRAWSHAQIEHNYQRAVTRLTLSRSDFSAQRRRIQSLLKQLHTELSRLLTDHGEGHADKLDAVRRIEDGRRAHTEDWDRFPDELSAVCWPLPVLLAPIIRQHHEFSLRLMAVLDHLEASVRRQRGHQRQPWIAHATRELCGAGVRKAEADEILRPISPGP